MPLEKLCLTNQFIQRHITHVLYAGGLQEKACKAVTTAFGTQGQAETSFKIKILRSNKATGKLS